MQTVGQVERGLDRAILKEMEAGATPTEQCPRHGISDATLCI
jgi:hypothetical protein